MRAKTTNAILASVLSVALLCLFTFLKTEAANEGLPIPNTPEYTMNIDKIRAAGEGVNAPGEEITSGSEGEFTWTEGDVFWAGIAITEDASNTEFPIDSNGIDMMEIAVDYNSEYLTPYTDIDKEQITDLGETPSDEAKWAAIIAKYNIGADITGGWEVGYEIASVTSAKDIGETDRTQPLPDGINTMAHITIVKKADTELTNPKLKGMGQGEKNYIIKFPFKMIKIPTVEEGKPEVLKLTREPEYLSMQDLGETAFKSSWMRTDPENGAKSENLSNWIKYAGDPSIFGLQTIVEPDPSSPLGSILGNANMSEAEKNKAEDIFKAENIINKGTIDEKYYNPGAWTDDTVNGTNYDHDSTTVVTKIATETDLQALAASKKPTTVYDSENAVVSQESIVTLIKNIDGTTPLFSSDDPIANMGVYKIEYRKTDGDGELLATRPLVVLVELGDIDMKNGIEKGDATALYNINKTGSQYIGVYKKLYKYRVADINQDDIVNSIDANHIQAQIDYNDDTHKIKQFYNMETGGGQ